MLIRHYKAIREHDRRLAITNDDCDGACLRDGKCRQKQCGELSLQEIVGFGLVGALLLAGFLGFLLEQYGDRLGAFLLRWVL